MAKLRQIVLKSNQITVLVFVEMCVSLSLKRGKDDGARVVINSGCFAHTKTHTHKVSRGLCMPHRGVILMPSQPVQLVRQRNPRETQLILLLKELNYNYKLSVQEKNINTAKKT